MRRQASKGDDYRIILMHRIQYEDDVVSARGRAKDIAVRLGFNEQDQVRIATAVSEIARNAFMYAGGGKVEYMLEDDSGPQRLLIRVSDDGPGITDINTVMEGTHSSYTGMGMGIVGARRLMDDLSIVSTPGEGATVDLRKTLSSNTRFTDKDIDLLKDEMSRLPAQSVFEELQTRNQDLLAAMNSLQQRQEELAELNLEMEETNRGIMALYTELDEKNRQLELSYKQKTAFLANMSHELRTPINSIVSLSRLLLTGDPENMGEEQRKQVDYIRRTGEDFLQLVNDLLDIAKIETGRNRVSCAMVQVSELFGSLERMFRPLVADARIDMVFEDVRDLPPIETDEGKLAQILRNLVSNALKYTEKGVVRVSAMLSADQQQMVFSVSDTGIGIAPGDQKSVFLDFVQIDSHLQRQHKGAGLGLPLSKNLTELLGGEISLQSELGAGTTFVVTFPLQYCVSELRGPQSPARPQSVDQDSTRFNVDRRKGPADRRKGDPRILIVDDDPMARYLMKSHLNGMELSIIEAENGELGLLRAIEDKPQVIFLDLLMPVMDGFEVLESLKKDPRTRDIPVVVVTSRKLSKEESAKLSMDTVAVIAKGKFSSETIVGVLNRAIGPDQQRPCSIS